MPTYPSRFAYLVACVLAFWFTGAGNTYMQSSTPLLVFVDNWGLTNNFMDWEFSNPRRRQSGGG